jgi:hypothetical protein
LNNVLAVAERRTHLAAVVACEKLALRLQRLNASSVHQSVEREQDRQINELCVQLEFIVDHLAMLTKLEIREVLFPLPEIKKQTREFGEAVSSNYFSWLSENDHYEPERLMAILEEDLQRLEIAKEFLSKRGNNHHSNRK